MLSTTLFEISDMRKTLGSEALKFNSHSVSNVEQKYTCGRVGFVDICIHTKREHGGGGGKEKDRRGRERERSELNYQLKG